MAWHLAAVGVALAVSLFLGSIFYNLFLSPLRHIPGPKLSAASRIPYLYHHLRGSSVFYLRDLHERYGDAVRYTPNEVSFTSIDTAWNDIYGFRTGKLKGHANMQKDSAWFPEPPNNGTPDLLLNNDEDHARVRRVVSHAFSEKALSEQEPLLVKYADILISGLKETISTNDEPVNMLEWLEWTSFDVIADLVFGKPFGGLTDRRTHQFVHLLLNSSFILRYIYVVHYMPWLTPLLALILNSKETNARDEFAAWAREQTEARMSMDTQRPDFMTHILANNKDSNKLGKMSNDEVAANMNLFLIAGTETTSTLLTGLTYLLCKNPAVMEKAKQEVRSRFKSSDEINLREIGQSPYLVACLQEALRYFPPIPTGFLRSVGKGGDFVSGHFVPEGTGLCVSPWPAHHLAHNFTDPDEFAPERWLGEDKFATDKLKSMQAFSFGPRTCLGKNLATAEMRLFLTKLLWSFDIELDSRSANWIEGLRVQAVWKMPPLLVKLTDVRQDTAATS